MTSPVERISGPRIGSTTRPERVRKRLKGSTASLTAMTLGMPGVEASSAGSAPRSRNWAMDSPAMSRAAALARATPVALETKGTVREALGLASMT